jgi:hypothetical protein
MTCPDCERYKASAKNWRHKAYELSGHPLPWEGGETWVSLTDEEMRECAQAMDAEPLAEGWKELVKFARAIEAKSKEKNSG